MIYIPPGRYIIAVSGGVDSMVLCDMARQAPGVKLIVAHVNHGIRMDGHEDEWVVAQYAKKYGLQFVSTTLNLGVGASEAQARQVRYNFLQQCRKKYKAEAILLAHHQDDMIETALIALVRGTGWRGLAPFASSSMLLRPLLHLPKHKLIAYARSRHVPWREDSTNTDETYLRNYVRHTLCALLDQKDTHWRDDLLRIIRKQQRRRRTIEENLAVAVKQVGQVMDSRTIYSRHAFIMAPRRVAYELLQHLMRATTGNSLQAQHAYRTLLFIRVAKPGKRMPLTQTWQLRVSKKHFIVEASASVLSYNKQL